MFSGGLRSLGFLASLELGFKISRCKGFSIWQYRVEDAQT